MSDTIDVVPVSEVPKSLLADEIRSIVQRSNTELFPNVLSSVSGAILEKYTTKPFVIENGMDAPWDLSLRQSYHVAESASILTKVPTRIVASWAQADDSVLVNAMDGTGWGRPNHELNSWPLYMVKSGLESTDGTHIANYLTAVHLLPTLSISARRLISSMLKQGSGDKAIDIAIALESLLTPDSSTELNFRICLRGALLLESEVGLRKEMRENLARLYKLRSQMVHTGTHKDQYGDKSASQIADLGLEVGCRLVRKLVVDKALPDWTHLELAG